MSVILLLCAMVSAGQRDPASRWELAREIVCRSGIADTEYQDWLGSRHACVRKAALFRMMEQGDSRLESLIQGSLDDSSWSVRRQAAHALERCGTVLSRSRLESAALSMDSPAVRSRAIYALGFLADSRSSTVISALLKDPAWDVRGLAADQVRYFDRRDLLPELESLAENDPTEYVKLRARGSIEHLSRAARHAGPPAPASESPGQTLSGRILLAVALSIPIVLVLGMFVGTERTRRAASALVLMIAIVIGVRVTASLWLRDHSSASTLLIRVEPALQAYWHDQYGIAIAGILEAQKDFLKTKVGSQVVITTETCMLPSAWNEVRGQYDADSALGILSGLGEARLVYLTREDLYQEPFHHTMGVGRPGTAVISASRLDPLWLEEGPGDSEDASIFVERFGKLVLHEIGHLHGLDHCPKDRCLMRSVETPEDFFRLDPAWCAECTACAAAWARLAR